MAHGRIFAGVLDVGALACVCSLLSTLAPSAASAAPPRGSERTRRTADAASIDPSRESRGGDRVDAPPAEKKTKTRRAESREIGRPSESRTTSRSTRGAKTAEVSPGPSASADARAVTTPALRDLAEADARAGAPSAMLPAQGAIAKTLAEKSSSDVLLADAPRGARTLNDASAAARSGAPAAGSTGLPAGRAPLSRDLAGSAGVLRRDTIVDATIPSANRAVSVALDPLVFDHDGDVPRATAALERLKGAFVRCATTDTAVLRDDAAVDLRFLVRAPGRAEGVDVEKSRGLSGDVVRCVSSTLSRTFVGAPSDDPVGVSVSIHFRKD